MGAVANFRGVTEAELARSRRDASYATRLLLEVPEGDEIPPTSGLSLRRRAFFVEGFSFLEWEDLLFDAPVEVFMIDRSVDLDWSYGADADGPDADGPDGEAGSQAMVLEPEHLAELADWLRAVRFEDVCEGPDEPGWALEEEFEEFRAFVLAVAERGESVLFHFG
ncbi:hypothetical protein [Streptomyces oceani]|uniref:DUF1877 family protein n=1 Tax=Streptomyces oceani TaxID=1075402 RepID=A0A1E7JX36_9ACTN|nr:hypothetical protein [Streptomyces oceani]OEU96237.1 hypothetical protein AN216_21300 [Streptomyces oceani]